MLSVPGGDKINFPFDISIGQIDRSLFVHVVENLCGRDVHDIRFFKDHHLVLTGFARLAIGIVFETGLETAGDGIKDLKNFIRTVEGDAGNYHPRFGILFQSSVPDEGAVFRLQLDGIAIFQAEGIA